jgi:hypothetical protein
MQLRMLFFGVALVLSGCATYQTPGAGIAVGHLAGVDEDIAEVMLREPLSTFPARLAVVRVQSPGYSRTNDSCYGRGRYCVVTARDIESEEDFGRLSMLPEVAGVAPLGRMLLPEQLDGVKDLRLAAAHLKTDILLVYSLDTRFHVENTDVGPLAVVTLGFIRDRNARISTTAAAALFDVRSGFVYGVAEATARQDQRASIWSTGSAIDNARQKTEVESFQLLLDEIEKLWRDIVSTNAEPANNALETDA